MGESKTIIEETEKSSSKSPGPLCQRGGTSSGHDLFPPLRRKGGTGNASNLRQKRLVIPAKAGI